MLPDDVARCPGEGDDQGNWREGCEDCQRRTDRNVTKWRAKWIAPPRIITFECEFYIPPEVDHGRR